MNQNNIIPCIVSLNKLLALTIDNYFINYETLKKSIYFYEYEQLQIKVHTLKEQLIEGFSWYCGSTIENEEKKIKGDLFDPENANPFRQQYNLLTLALEKTQNICSGLVAKHEYKVLFTEIKNTCEEQLLLISNIIQKTSKKNTESHFIPKYVKRREIPKVFVN